MTDIPTKIQIIHEEGRSDISISEISGSQDLEQYDSCLAAPTWGVKSEPISSSRYASTSPYIGCRWSLGSASKSVKP